jgi:hypothetical protein
VRGGQSGEGPRAVVVEGVGRWVLVVLQCVGRPTLVAGPSRRPVVRGPHVDQGGVAVLQVAAVGRRLGGMGGVVLGAKVCWRSRGVEVALEGLVGGVWWLVVMGARVVLRREPAACRICCTVLVGVGRRQLAGHGTPVLADGRGHGGNWASLPMLIRLLRLKHPSAAAAAVIDRRRASKGPFGRDVRTPPAPGRTHKLSLPATLRAAQVERKFGVRAMGSTRRGAGRTKPD